MVQAPPPAIPPLFPCPTPGAVPSMSMPPLMGQAPTPTMLPLFPSTSPTPRGRTTHNPSLFQSPIQPFQTLLVYPHYRSPEAKLLSYILLSMTLNAPPHGSGSKNTKSCSTAIWHPRRSLLQPLLPHRRSYHIRPNKPSSANPF